MGQEILVFEEKRALNRGYTPLGLFLDRGVTRQYCTIIADTFVQIRWPLLPHHHAVFRVPGHFGSRSVLSWLHLSWYCQTIDIGGHWCVVDSGRHFATDRDNTTQ